MLFIYLKQVDGTIRRNDPIRNTLQNGYKALPSNQANENIYRGSITPTPTLRYLTPSHGTSQISLNSTNPFDEEDDNISRAESVDIGSIRRSGRKKRRAPLPPVTSTPVVVCIYIICFYNKFNPKIGCRNFSTSD